MALTLSSQTGFLLRRSNSELPRRPPPKSAVVLSSSTQHHSKSASLSFHPLKTFTIAAKQSRARVSASHDSRSPVLSPPIEPQSILVGSTRTVTTVVTLAFALSRLFLNSVQKLACSSLLPDSTQLAAIRALRGNLVDSAGPLFFAVAGGRAGGGGAYLNTPLAVVAAGLGKWLDIYSAVLLVRVLLSWFPNIPWDRQPLSAIRDLCDPYLSLFRNILPPVFGALDVSPLLAFTVLGTLGTILRGSGTGLF